MKLKQTKNIYKEMKWNRTCLSVPFSTEWETETTREKGSKEEKTRNEICISRIYELKRLCANRVIIKMTSAIPVSISECMAECWSGYD